MTGKTIRLSVSLICTDRSNGRSSFLIEKLPVRNSTISNIRPLEREESIQELARMLGGVKITDTVLQNAKEMKEMADAVR